MEKYEVKNVTQASEIKNAYDTAIAENKQYYRTISNTGKIYGWVNGKHVIADNTNAVMVDGEFWFANPQYVEPIVEETAEEVVEEVVEQTEEEIIEEVCDTMQEMVEETQVVEPQVDYKALYDKQVEENEALIKNTHELVKELEAVKTEFANYKAIVEAFKKL